MAGLAIIDLTSDLSDAESAPTAAQERPQKNPPGSLPETVPSVLSNSAQGRHACSQQHIDTLSRTDAQLRQPGRAVGGVVGDTSPAVNFSRPSGNEPDHQLRQSPPASRVVNWLDPQSSNLDSAAAAQQDVGGGRSASTSCGKRELSEAPPPEKRVRRKALSPDVKERREAEKKRRMEAAAEKRAKRDAEQIRKTAERDKKKQEKIERDAQKERDRVAKLQQRAATKEARGGLKDHAMSVQLSKELVLSPVGRLLTEELQAAKPPYHVDLVDGPLSPLRTVTWTTSDTRGRRREAEGKGIPAAQPAPGVDDDDEQVVPYLLIHLQAAEYVAIVTGADGLEGLLAQVAAVHPDRTLGLLLQGVDNYLTTLERRQYRQNDGELPSFDRNVVDAATLDLAVRYPGVRFTHIHDNTGAAEHVVFLTRALAKQPFAPQVSEFNVPSSFSGGSSISSQLWASNPLCGPQKSLYKALQCIPSLSSASQHAVAAHYSSLASLSAALLDPTRSEKASVAAMLGTGSTRRIGPAAAQKLHQLLTTLDPDAPLVT